MSPSLFKLNKHGNFRDHRPTDVPEVVPRPIGSSVEPKWSVTDDVALMPQFHASHAHCTRDQLGLESPWGDPDAPRGTGPLAPETINLLSSCCITGIKFFSLRDFCSTWKSRFPAGCLRSSQILDAPVEPKTGSPTEFRPRLGLVSRDLKLSKDHCWK